MSSIYWALHDFCSAFHHTTPFQPLTDSKGVHDFMTGSLGNQAAEAQGSSDCPVWQSDSMSGSDFKFPSHIPSHCSSFTQLKVEKKTLKPVWL